MLGALVGAVTCGRCGTSLAEVPPGGGCRRCGARRVGASSGSSLGSYSGLLAGVQAAHPARRRLAVVVDAAPVVAAVVVVFVAAPGAFGSDEGIRAMVIGFAAIALVLYVGASVAARHHLGRSLGRAVLGLRLVDDLTGLPPRLGMFGLPWVRPSSSAWRRRLVVADLVRGRDPIALAAPMPDTAALSPAAPDHGLEGDLPPASADRRSPFGRSPTVFLILDTGERLEMETTLLVGRLPVGTADDPHPTFAWPDLARSLSKTHALLEWTGTELWVTDLGSTNGSALIAPDGRRQPLVQGLRGTAAPGWTVQLGQRRFGVQPSGVLAVVEDAGSREELLQSAAGPQDTASEGVRNGR